MRSRDGAKRVQTPAARWVRCNPPPAVLEGGVLRDPEHGRDLGEPQVAWCHGSAVRRSRGDAFHVVNRSATDAVASPSVCGPGVSASRRQAASASTATPGRRCRASSSSPIGTRPVANGGRPRRATPRPSALRCFRVCAEAGASGVRPNRPACGRSGPSPARGFPRRAAPREPLHFHKLASRILIAELQEIFRSETRRRRSDRDAEPRGGRVLSRPASPWSPRSAPGWWSPRQLHRDRRWPGRSPGRPRAPCSTAPGRTARPSASVPGWRR